MTKDKLSIVEYEKVIYTDLTDISPDERLEKLLNHFGQTISDLPKSADNDWSGAVYESEHLISAKKEALAFIMDEWRDTDAVPEIKYEVEEVLLDYICHLADIIDRMETALSTAQRVTTCKSCQHHKALLAKDWDNVPCSECNSSQCRLHYQISDEYLSDINQNEAETILKGRPAE